MTARLGRYPFEDELGRGAMGVIYRGLHPSLGVPVAIKVLAEAYCADPAFRERFKREAATIAALNHPGIVRVYDFDNDEGALFIVMEYVEGRSLRSWVRETGRFPIAVAEDVLQQMLSAVGSAHLRGVVHRDLKPDNVLVSTAGKTKILDFGISKVLGEDQRHLTATGSMMGTPAYMSPEQARGEPVDGRADVYALGVILYELIHGRPPFTGAMPDVVHAQCFAPVPPTPMIPPALFEVVERAMAKRPGDRFQSCEEFSGALLAWRGTRPGVVDTPPPEAPPPTRAGTRDWIAAADNRIRSTGGGPPIGGVVGGCAHTECEATEGWRCSYEDPTGARCVSWWCKRHIVFVGAAPFCSRHATVLRALAATAGTIREIKHRPAVDDRSLNLAQLVAEDVDRDLTELLRRRFQARHDVRVVADHAIRQTWEGQGMIAWERSWAAVRNQGYLTRIGVRVGAAAPDLVRVSLGQLTVLEEVPEWITQRRLGEVPDRAERARFRNRVVEAVLGRIDSPLVTPAAAEIATPRHGTTLQVDPGLLAGMTLRGLEAVPRLTGYELGERLAVPYEILDQALRRLAADSLVAPLGFSSERGPWENRPLPERMAWAITTAGREAAERWGATGTRYTGPAPVSAAEYAAAVAAAARPPVLGPEQVAAALAGLELSAGVVESIRSAVNSRASILLYGPPGNGKTSLARRLAALQGPPCAVPVAVQLDTDVLRVFDPSIHRLAGEQPLDRRWRMVERPLVQVGGEFTLEMLEAAWEPGSRTYQAPLQVMANGGVLLVDDLGRQRATPSQVLERLLIPLQQGIDFLVLSASGRKAEVPFRPQLALSTNLWPSDLLDEAHLRRLAYRVLMPDLGWEAYERVLDREAERLGVPAPRPEALRLIRTLYGDRPVRGSHPRDLLERLVDVAAARGIPPEPSPALLEAAWRTLFVGS